MNFLIKSLCSNSLFFSPKSLSNFSDKSNFKPLDFFGLSLIFDGTKYRLDEDSETETETKPIELLTLCSNVLNSYKKINDKGYYSPEQNLFTRSIQEHLNEQGYKIQPVGESDLSYKL
jgi:hypothetical protein